LKFSELKTLDGWLTLLALIRPKFYNKLTWFVVAAGVGILTTPFIEIVISAVLGKTFDLEILDGNESFVGLTMIGLALLYNIACQFMEAVEKGRQLSKVTLSEETHDRERFGKLDGLLDEVTLKQTLDWVDTNEFYTEEQWSCLYEYVHESSQTSSIMLNPEVEENRKTLEGQINSLLSFMAQHFFYRAGSSRQDDPHHYLYPDLNPDMDGDYEGRGIEKYHQNSKELHEHINGVRSAYDSYRKMVKRQLYC
jgi:hypothetical protein|tara:strand:- start:372 stop:1127 length:756 start_codon:yes stop_codon:yes gene_type:complete